MATTQTMQNGYRPGQKRQRPLEVLSLGMSRTGTASMAKALSILGYDHVAHGLELLDELKSPYIDRWEQAGDAKYLGIGKPFTREDWDELLGHCGAITDFPCIYYWRELCEAYPEAKVILVQRDEDAWFDSFREIAIDAIYAPGAILSKRVIEPILGITLSRTNWKLVHGYFQAKDYNDFIAKAKPVYRKHYDDIRATVPPEQLLEYKLGSGWEPLCKFLGKNKPLQPFPQLNERAELVKHQQRLQAKARKDAVEVLLWRILPVTAVVGIVLLAWRLQSK